MKQILFGPAGNSDSFTQQGHKSTVDTPAWLAQMGLHAFEYQCGRGVNIGETTARKIGANAAAHGIHLSLHAPYYINLSSIEPERVEKNIGYVLASCQAATWMGATRIVVHTGGLGKLTRTRAFENTQKNVKTIVQAVAEAGYTQTICLETMGKQSVIGTAEEIFSLVALDDRLLPCIDFGHLNARTGGGMNTLESFAALLDQMEQTIGKERTQIFHAHFSKIEYSDKGEVRHLTFADEKYGPEFTPLGQLLAERQLTPTIICESAGTQAEDALWMQNTYQNYRNI